MKIPLVSVLILVMLLCTSCNTESTGKARRNGQLSSPMANYSVISSKICFSSSSSNGTSLSSMGVNHMTKNSGFSSNSNSVSLSSSQKPLTSSEVSVAQKEISDKISHVVNTTKIDKVELCSGTKSVYYLDSANSSMISAWVALVKKMKVSAIPFNPTGGTLGYDLSFYIDGKAVTIGSSFTDGNIYTDSKRVMYTIDNYAELKSEFQTLQKKMGFPKAE